MEGLTRVNALIVPQEAIMQGANGSYVYIVNDKNMVESVNIQTGLMTKEGGWIVDSGLKAGDRVIVSNLMKIRPGMTVDPKTWSSRLNGKPSRNNPGEKAMFSKFLLTARFLRPSCRWFLCWRGWFR